MRKKKEMKQAMRKEIINVNNVRKEGGGEDSRLFNRFSVHV